MKANAALVGLVAPALAETATSKSLQSVTIAVSILEQVSVAPETEVIQNPVPERS